MFLQLLCANVLFSSLRTKKTGVTKAWQKRGKGETTLFPFVPCKQNRNRLFTEKSDEKAVFMLVSKLTPAVVVSSVQGDR